jgi:uncharacterized protein (DUF488 family)
MTSPPAGAGPRLISIGHSNHEPGAFLDLLRGAGVAAVADVRSSPFSRRLPHFNGPQLEAFLRRNQLAYVYLGDFLGGRPRDDALYDDEGRVDYERVRTTAAFALGLERLLLAAEEGAVAMLCAEEDPLDCHRGLMITPALVERGIRPLHLCKGGVETTDEMERRLLEETGLLGRLEPDLFTPAPDEAERRRVLADAYRMRARRKAYRRDQQGEG